MKRALVVVTIAAGLLCATPSRARAADRYALIVSGAAGNADYERQYAEWRESLGAILRAKSGWPDDHVIVLADASGAGTRKPTRENVRAAFAGLKARTGKDDEVLIFLIGHGNSSEASNDGAKFNLVGPDLSAKEWADLVKPIAGRVVFVNGASGSAPFLQTLSARGRIVITATDTTAQQYETIFPEFFIEAFKAEAADTDKNGKVSVLEAFVYASGAVRQWYQDRGRLQTERALLDDNGDGIGREAQSPGTDGGLAAVTYFEPDAPAAGAGSSLAARRAALEARIDQLKVRRPEMPPAQYDAEMEALLIDLARIDAQLRAR